VDKKKELAEFYKKRLASIGFKFSTENGDFRKEVSKSQFGRCCFLVLDSRLEKLHLAIEENGNSSCVRLKNSDIKAIQFVSDIMKECGNE
jgi:hypothetical protein